MVFETLKIGGTFDNEVRIYSFNGISKGSYIAKSSSYEFRLKEKS